MKVLIVSAHPEPKSFCIAMRDAGIAKLREAGHEVILSDLYAMNFNPVAGPEDFLDRSDEDYLVYALEQRHANEKDALAPDIKAELDKLLACDLLILNFPVFWFSVPAIMKGWFDRVFVSGATYGGRRFYDRGGLQGKRALVAATLGSRDYMFGPDGIHGEVETSFRHLLLGTLGYVGLTVLPPFLAWHVPYISQSDREAVCADYIDYLDRLDSLQPLTVPSLSDFDDTMAPRARLAGSRKSQRVGETIRQG